MATLILACSESITHHPSLITKFLVGAESLELPTFAL